MTTNAKTPNLNRVLTLKQTSEVVRTSHNVLTSLADCIVGCSVCSTRTHTDVSFLSFLASLSELLCSSALLCWLTSLVGIKKGDEDRLRMGAEGKALKWNRRRNPFKEMKEGRPIDEDGGVVQLWRSFTLLLFWGFFASSFTQSHRYLACVDKELRNSSLYL